VVNLWCDAWLVWYLNSHIFEVEKYATFPQIILKALHVERKFRIAPVRGPMSFQRGSEGLLLLRIG
jgi:hypothetical protein